MNITNITRIAINDGYGWRFFLSDDETPTDVWLDGTRILENYEGESFDVVYIGNTPPPVEVCEYGARPVNAWACRFLAVQWFAFDHRAFALTEWRDGEAYSVKFVNVPFPNLYHTEKVVMAEGDTVQQTWTVQAAILYEPDRYVIDSQALPVTFGRYYLPRPPVNRWTYSATTGKVTVT